MYKILNYFTSNTENSVSVFHGSMSSHVSLRLGTSATLNLDTYIFQSALLKARCVHCGQKERALCVSPLHSQPLRFPIQDNRVHKHTVQNVCCKANTRLYEQQDKITAFLYPSHIQNTSSLQMYFVMLVLRIKKQHSKV